MKDDCLIVDHDLCVPERRRISELHSLILWNIPAHAGEADFASTI